MACWLLKTEPSEYSFADLQRDKRTVWSGIANAAALKNLRAVRKGDDLLIYHTGVEKAVVGLAHVVKNAYPDPAGDDPKQVVIDIAASKALPRPVTLGAIKADPRLREWGLVRIGRLSVVPTTPEQFKTIQEMARAV